MSPSLKRIYILVDPSHGLKESDVQIMKLLDGSGLSYQVVLTKMDRLSKTKYSLAKSEIEAQLPIESEVTSVLVEEEAEEQIQLESNDNSTEDKIAEDESTEDKSTEDKSTEDESTEDKSTEDKSTEDESTEDKSTEDENSEDKSAEAGLSSIDLQDELKFTQERLEVIASEERTGADAEKVALEELQKSTESLISIRKELSEKHTQLSSLDEGDSSRSEIQSEVDRLTLERDEKEHQWSATKEVWRREFGPIEDNTSDSAKNNETKAKTEYDIKLLQEQITNLQKQLDAVSIRRKQMAAEAEEQQKRLAEHGEIDGEEGEEGEENENDKGDV
ncbi:hypothetical protein BGZ46_001703 [Entomortierella lignicola]|nr:hypothetical protein BGZ46_001703 [Entomortierella lignicola]